MTKVAFRREILENCLDVCIGSSDWLTISQDRIDLFAEVTQDRGWIHVDPERVRTQTSFGGTIAHGFLILSLVFKFLYEIFDFSSVPFGLNYGLDKVRFISPVEVGSQIRMHVTPRALIQRSSSEILITLECEMDTKGQSRPVMIAQLLLMLNL